MLSIVFYTIIAASLFYLGSRAMITKPIWSLYPRPLAAFMDCAACVGFWWGFGLSIWLGDRRELDAMVKLPDRWMTPVAIGLMMIVLVPIVAGFMQAGFERLGTVVDDGETK